MYVSDHGYQCMLVPYHHRMSRAHDISIVCWYVVSERADLTRQLELYTGGASAESASEFHAEEWRVNYEASIKEHQLPSAGARTRCSLSGHSLLLSG